MRKITIEIDAGEAECGFCELCKTGEFSGEKICLLFDAYLNDDKRCQACLDAEKESEK